MPRAETPATGWGPGLLQDDFRALYNWFANKANSRQQARDAAQLIKEKRDDKS